MANISKSQKRLLIVLALVLLYAVYDMATNWDNYFGFYTGKKTQKSSQAAAVKKIKTADSSAVALRLIWKKDPFYQKKNRRRRAKKAAPVNRLRLKAISYAGENSVAMINSKIMSVGDIISGYKVLKIEEKKVILGKGAKSKVLTLK